MAELGLELFARNRLDIKPTANRVGAGVGAYHKAPVFQDFLNQVLTAEIAGERHVRWYRHDLTLPAAAASPPGSSSGDAMEAIWKPQIPKRAL